MIKTIIIEDDLMVASINQQFAMKTPGIQVIATFHNGKDALHFLRETSVDLILLDLYMPEMSGLELLKELRKENNPVDVIMVTAANDTEHINEALQLGIIDYLLKPFQYERFSEALDKYLVKRKIIENGLICTQQQIDQFLRRKQLPEKKKKLELQKGLQQITLDKILHCLESHPDQYVKSDMISKETELSQVTARRYLNYLVDTDVIDSRIDYSTGGRPCVEYKFKQTAHV